MSKIELSGLRIHRMESGSASDSVQVHLLHAVPITARDDGAEKQLLLLLSRINERADHAAIVSQRTHVIGVSEEQFKHHSDADGFVSHERDAIEPSAASG